MAKAQHDTLPHLGLHSQLHHDMPTLFQWLDRQGLTEESGVFDRPTDAAEPALEMLSRNVVLAQSTSRRESRPSKRDDLKALKERFKDRQLGVSQDAMWGAVKNAEAAVRELQWTKLPADALAFYRPFHFPPFDQWGIYLLIGPLLNYHHELVQQSQQLKVFSPETLMHLVLFEVFNHEFFHHLVEATATTLEIVFAAQGRIQPVFLRYWAQQAANTFNHPHAPLEEALANAYAYNALGFISRVKVGFKTASVKAYQQAIAKHWHCEPPGYRDAGRYIGGDYVGGGARLLEHLLDAPEIANEVPLSVLAKHVMPAGFSAFMAKPDIPTWLVGDEAELKLLQKLVPAPNEAYTQLFWPYNTDSIDQFIAKKQAEEKARKAAQKSARIDAARTGDLFDGF
ncbi:hypothetical protein [Methylocaldum sp. GT1BB]|jgi:hypothetical protein|uniref:hypothetical protein n=1 Tax=Methylocaldum sp. GT1BB TaxID=3438963 RepID=UPI003DA0F443